MLRAPWGWSQAASNPASRDVKMSWDVRVDAVPGTDPVRAISCVAGIDVTQALRHRLLEAPAVRVPPATRAVGLPKVSRSDQVSQLAAQTRSNESR